MTFERPTKYALRKTGDGWVIDETDHKNTVRQLVGVFICGATAERVVRDCKCPSFLMHQGAGLAHSLRRIIR